MNRFFVPLLNTAYAFRIFLFHPVAFRLRLRQRRRQLYDLVGKFFRAAVFVQHPHDVLNAAPPCLHGVRAAVHGLRVHQIENVLAAADRGPRLVYKIENAVHAALDFLQISGRVVVTYVDGRLQCSERIHELRGIQIVHRTAGRVCRALDALDQILCLSEIVADFAALYDSVQGVGKVLYVGLDNSADVKPYAGTAPAADASAIRHSITTFCLFLIDAATRSAPENAAGTDR